MSDLTLRKYSSFGEMKADEYRYWQSWPVQERMDAVEEMIHSLETEGLGDGAGCTRTTKTFCPPSMPMALGT